MTLCSGIGAPEVAAPWIDWRFASEIEMFPRAVLRERFGYQPPEDHNQGDPLLWGDMTEVTPELLRQHGIPLPDIIVAGTPCQAFSVAGLRGGTNDTRGNLTLKFVEICNGIVAARPDGRLAVLWENVPGILSDEGNAFGCFLGGLVGAVDALPPPADGRWPGEGMVQGPRARAAWAILDAQWFGVAQRRRRVFVVVDFGNCVDPAEVLLEPDRLRGDTPPRRETGQEPAASLTASTGGCSRKDSTEGRVIVSEHPFSGTVSSKWSKGCGGPAGDECQNLVAHTLRGEGFDASEDGTGRGTPLVPIAIQERAVCENPDAGPDGAGYRQDDTAYTLEARTQVQAVAFAENSRGELRLQGGDGTVSPQLTTGGGKPGQGQPCIAFDCIGSECRFTTGGLHQTLRSMGHAGGHAAVATPWAVRRLTPRECERLQGFPDNHCAISYRNKPAADGPQYRALGNSMAVPVIAWILERMHK